MSNEEILNELLKSTREMQSSIKVMQDDIKGLKNEVTNLNNKFNKLEEKVDNLDEKVDNLDEKFINLDGKVRSIDGTVMKMEHEHSYKIDLIYENIQSFINSNNKNKMDIKKLDKRVERLECMMPIKPINQKEA